MRHYECSEWQQITLVCSPQRHSSLYTENIIDVTEFYGYQAVGYSEGNKIDNRP